MLKIQEIRELIKLIDESSINEFKFEQNGSKVTMKKQFFEEHSQGAPTVVTDHKVAQQSAVQPLPSPPEKPQPVEKVETENAQNSAVADQNLHTITSPMVGTFYESPSPEEPAYIKVGDQVKSDSVVCIVEAMKLMNEIEAEVKGEIVEILVENGQLVEYGQELFLVRSE